MMETMNNKELETRVDRAVDYFMQGYGCCQSAARIFADYLREKYLGAGV